MFISPAVREKLADPTHQVTEDEILQCFANRDGRQCYDERPEHRSNPPTLWFVAETDYGRRLKVCYILHADTKLVEIKSAYLATDEVTRIYNKYAK
jgi:hypothetical protein